MSVSSGYYSSSVKFFISKWKVQDFGYFISVDFWTIIFLQMSVGFLIARLMSSVHHLAVAEKSQKMLNIIVADDTVFQFRIAFQFSTVMKNEIDTLLLPRRLDCVQSR